MQHKVRWEEMFRDELEVAIAARPVCYLAYGLAEPHGVQNAIGLDGLKAQALVEAAARAHGGVVAPMTWWHVHETPRGVDWLAGQNAPMPRLTNVPADLFLRQLVYQLRAVDIAGFKAAILVTGHYGGIEIDMRVTAQLYAANRPLRATALADWEIMTYSDYRGDHAGVCETSQLWALRPELVDLSRMPAEPFEGKLFASDERARQSSRREGEKIVAAQVASLKKLSDRMLSEADGDTGVWFSFAEAEAIWQQMEARRSEWISSHPAEGFGEYLQQQHEVYPAPEV
jgi:creatinine amidohydrolase